MNWCPCRPAEVEQAARQLLDSGVEAIAICFLHAYRNPTHEQVARDIVLRAFPTAQVTISSEVLPEFREYERTSTTVLNAYVLPKMRGYLARLRARVADAGVTSDLLTIHSNGGLISLDTAERLPVLTCLSGPAAGVVGAAALGGMLGMPDIVTFDVGGTSTDVSVDRQWPAPVHLDAGNRPISAEDADDRHPCDWRRGRQHRRGR